MTRGLYYLWFVALVPGLLVPDGLGIAEVFGEEIAKTDFPTPFEMGDGWETATYESGIQYYADLAEASDQITLHTMGKTDSGFPLSVVLITDSNHVDLAAVSQDERTVLLINNAIHPGESDGVDASMAFARDLVADSNIYAELLQNVIVAIIPFYNIGGALNRNTGTRANQNGPREYGFRGNGRNYDLNRDFMKCDTRNAKSFAEIFQLLDPDFLLIRTSAMGRTINM